MDYIEIIFFIIIIIAFGLFVFIDYRFFRRVILLFREYKSIEIRYRKGCNKCGSVTFSMYRSCFVCGMYCS